MIRSFAVLICNAAAAPRRFLCLTQKEILMKKTLLAMLASAALTLVMGSVAFADEPTSSTTVASNADTSAPVITKQVKDLDGATLTDANWQDAADCDIQASVPFRLSAQLPADFESYKSYELTFHDIMAKSLTFDENSLKVYCENPDGSQTAVFGANVASPVEGISLATTNIPKGETFNLIIDDVRAIPNATAGTTISVEYEATLNDKAVTGAIETGNPNRAYIAYPESPESGTLATSAKALATVFTYKVTMECQDGQGNPLPGAQFKLYKKADGGYQEVTNSQFTPDAGGSIFTAKGLDEGQYKISEVIAPEGCTPTEDIYFTLVGTYETGDHGVQLTKYEYVLTDEAGNPVDEPEEVTFFVDKDKGNLSRTVVHGEASTATNAGVGNLIVFAIAAAVVLIGAAVTIIVIRKGSSKTTTK